MKGRSNRQVAKVARKLEKASKAHAQQAKILKKVAKANVGGQLRKLIGKTGLLGAVNALRGRSKGGDEAQINPRNQPVDEQGNPTNQPVPGEFQVSRTLTRNIADTERPAGFGGEARGKAFGNITGRAFRQTAREFDRMSGGGAIKTGPKKKINKVIKGLKKASKLHAGQAKSLESVVKVQSGGLIQPDVEKTAVMRRDRRALDGLAQRGITKGILK